MLPEPDREKSHVKFAIVVQRYGHGIGGGAEEHARLLANALRPYVGLEVLTTCASDHHSWKNHYRPGMSEEDGIRILRFPTARRKNRALSFALSRFLFRVPHRPWLEDVWLRILGPHSPQLLEYLSQAKTTYSGFVFYTYLYSTTVWGLPQVRNRALLVPTAHDEPMLYLHRHRNLLAQPAAYGFMTPEEEELVREVAGRENSEKIPSVILGTEMQNTLEGDAESFRRKYGIDKPFFLYLGRMERSKGCRELFKLWRNWSGRKDHVLVLAGKRAMRIPGDSDIRHLGFISEEEKAGALASCEALILPSIRESLSLVILEAWAQNRPVIANGKCKPVAGQMNRSGGGVLYQDAASFTRALEHISSNKEAAAWMGRLGCSYVRKEYGTGRLAGSLLPFLAQLGWLSSWEPDTVTTLPSVSGEG